jgi:integrase
MNRDERDATVTSLPSARLRRAPDADAARDGARLGRIKILGPELNELAEMSDDRRPGSNHFLPVANLAASWLAGGRSDRTRTAYRADLARYFRWCAEHKINPAMAKTSQLRAYDLHLQGVAPHPRSPGRGSAGYAKSSRARYLSAVSSFYAFAHRRAEVSENPAVALVRPEKDTVSRRCLRLDEEAALWALISGDAPPALAALDFRDVCTLSVVLALGLDHAWRPGQFYAARVSDLTHLPPADPGAAAGGLLGVPAISTRASSDSPTAVHALSPRAVGCINQMLINGRGFASYIWSDVAKTTWDVNWGPLLSATGRRPMGRQWLSYMLEELAILAGIDPGRDTKHQTDRLTPLTLRRTALARVQETPAT